MAVLCVKKCDNCGADVEIKHKERLYHKNIFCSKKCEGEFKKAQTKPNCKCTICGKEFHVKPSHMHENITCSKECCKKYRHKLMSGSGNHQYGLKGELNASWKSDERITNYGYKKIRALSHPFKDCDGFVFEHRLVAEQYLLTDENSVEIDGKKYLNPDYEVHHKNRNKLDNRPENLLVVTKSEHMKIHAKLRRDDKNK